MPGLEWDKWHGLSGNRLGRVGHVFARVLSCGWGSCSRLGLSGIWGMNAACRDGSLCLDAWQSSGSRVGQKTRGRDTWRPG